MSIEAFSWAWELPLPVGQKMVLLVLADSYHRGGPDCRLNVERVCERAGMDYYSVYAAIDALQGLQYITVVNGKYRLLLPPEEIQPDNRVIPDAFIYVLSCEGLVKIGISQNVQTRLSSIQTSNPSRVELEHSSQAPLDVVRKWERLCHDKFAGARHSGEWFDVPVTEAVGFIKTLVGTRE